MLDCDSIFKNRKANKARLTAFGFSEKRGDFIYEAVLPKSGLCAKISVLGNGKVSLKAVDPDTGDEYALIHASGASGAFVGTVTGECEALLQKISDECFDTEIFKFPQTRQIIEYMTEKYKTSPEYLWEKFPDNAVFRRSDNLKWYAVILTVQRSKLGLEKIKSGESAEVVDLKAEPADISSFTDGKKYLPAYHMNKKHWFTICLDGSVSTSEITERIDKSFLLAGNR